MGSDMRAVVVREYGGPQVLAAARVPVPEPGPGEVLVKIAYAGVNPADWRIRSGQVRRFGTPPFSIGLDMAGTVETTGPGATRFQPGDRVYGVTIPPRGSYAQYAAVPESQLAAAPRRAGLREAAALPVTALTAWQALERAGTVEGSSRVLVHAAAGGVGHLAVQLAKARGAFVIGTAREANHSFVRGLGADEVLDYTATDFAAELAADGRRVDAVIDPISGDYGLRSLQVLRAGGVLVDVRGTGPVRTALRTRADELGLGLVELSFTPSGEDLATLATLVDQDLLRVSLARTYPLEHAAEAHATSESGRTRGKIVLSIAPDADADPLP
ncbi:NADP-dependent oxidoreductase [Streptomyces sp. SP17BM10]|uniref:NADP-dependent oxidoreductase n=1 Tax=Streptomyces sp. SP17BM10 TaxID=3002530 RepID=UPI002E796BD4|nr:NADP-dependent oxidoreductase [Streptomyces sp. SP17BM10]MEE1783803.1 NADP-dependent oxidoreductase [Streptomyces sp. SP17BM10]